MSELINVKIFENVIKLIQTDDGIYEVTEIVRDKDAAEIQRSYYNFESMRKGFSKCIKIISDHLMGILVTIHKLDL